jgi:hypothetical protein
LDTDESVEEIYEMQVTSHISISHALVAEHRQTMIRDPEVVLIAVSQNSLVSTQSSLNKLCIGHDSGGDMIHR